MKGSWGIGSSRGLNASFLRILTDNKEEKKGTYTKETSSQHHINQDYQTQHHQQWDQHTSMSPDVIQGEEHIILTV